VKENLESILIDIYYNTIDGDWSTVKMKSNQKKVIKDYIVEKKMKDPIGKPYSSYRLTDEGVVVAEFLIKKYARDTSLKFGGLVLEKRDWLIPMRHTMSTDHIIAGFKEIASRGNIPIEVRTDWDNRRKRVILRDLDRAISRISYEIKWELNKDKGVDYLVHMNGMSKSAAWLWLEVFDKHRKEIRDCSFQQEFVIWS